MKQIDKFVESVYEHIDGNEEEILELKKEMKVHLLEAVHELQAEGKTEYEAIKIAIQRFGGEKATRSIIRELFKKQRAFASWLLYIGITCLILSLLSYTFLLFQDNKAMKDVYKIEKNMLSVLKKEKVLTEASKNKLDVIAYNNGGEINQVLIYDLKNPSTSRKNIIEISNHLGSPIYEVSVNVWRNDKQVHIYRSLSDEKWGLCIYYYEYTVLKYCVLFLGITIYWVLFTIWAIIRASHQKRLNIGWIFSFLLFNVFGYLMFTLVRKKTI